MDKGKILTTKELAEYIKLNEKTIIKMAQRGELPGKKIANQWRFRLSVIDEYLQDNRTKTPLYDLSNVIKPTNKIPLSRLVSKSSIKLSLKSSDQLNVLRELVETAEVSGLTNAKDKLYLKLIEREEMLTTAIGKGVAIPHPRNPSDDLFDKPGIVIARAKEGIAFGAPDKKKVHLFFMPCAPDVNYHLKLLSEIAQIFKVKNIYQDFMTAKTNDEIIKILLNMENIKI